MEVYIAKPWFFTKTLVLLHKSMGNFTMILTEPTFSRQVVILQTCSSTGTNNGFYQHLKQN